MCLSGERESKSRKDARTSGSGRDGRPGPSHNSIQRNLSRAPERAAGSAPKPQSGGVKQRGVKGSAAAGAQGTRRGPTAARGCPGTAAAAAEPRSPQGSPRPRARPPARMRQERHRQRTRMAARRSPASPRRASPHLPQPLHEDALVAAAVQVTPLELSPQVDDSQLAQSPGFRFRTKGRGPTKGCEIPQSGR